MRTPGWKSLRSHRRVQKIALGLVLLTAGFVREAEGGVNRWTTTGPRFEGGVTVTSIAIAPSTPAVVYATANIGILKTVDDGANWDFVNTNLPNTVLFNIGAIDPSAPNTLYGCGQGGPFKSTDAGQSWTVIKSGIVEPLVGSPTFCITAVDPSNPSTLYGSTDLKGLFKTIDGGKSWSGISNGLPTSLYETPGVGVVPVIPGATLVIDASSPSTLYAFNRLGVFKSLNGGGNWSSINAGLPANVKALAIDPSQPNILYAGANPGVFKSTNRGESWTAVYTGAFGNLLWGIVVDPVASSTLYAATNNGVLKSTNSGDSWAVVLAGNIIALAIAPVAPGAVYAAQFGNDVFKSADGGKTWVRMNVGRNFFYGASVTAIASDPSSPGTVYAGTDVYGIFKSTNGGGSWKEINAGLPPYIYLDRLPSVGALAIDAVTPTTIYAGTAAGVFKSTDAGEHWTAAGSGLSGSVNALAIDPRNPATLYAGTSVGVFKSTDGGANWNAINTGFIGSRFVSALAIDPQTSTTLYAAVDTDRVFKSSDAGQTWTRLNTGPATCDALAIDPSAPATLYAGTRGLGLFRSRDGGLSWTAVPPGADSYSLDVRAVVIDGSAPSTLYAGTHGGVFRSRDSGETWTAINENLTTTDVRALTIDAASGTLYAGTAGGFPGFGMSLGGVFDYETVTPSLTCAPDSTTLCLNGSRFKVQVSWRSPDSGTNGAGNAIAVTGDTGFFWFFNGSNVELMVKVVDGRAFNDFFWVFFGALTNVEYTVTVTDSVTGATRTYFNPAGQFASVADTSAFLPLITRVSLPADESLGGAGSEAAETDRSGRGKSLEPAEPLQRVEGACTAGPATLCLNGGRFQVQVSWRVPSQGKAGVGTAASLTADTGYFWFFSGNNIELVIKVLNGRAINGRFWVFYGALSDVQYTVTVTDTQTGAVKTYFNPSGALASVADTEAF